MKPEPSALMRSKMLTIAFLVLVGANLLIGNASSSVWDQDEAAYAGFARHMLVRGDWVAPEFPYSQPHRKVPLSLWMIAASYAVLGVNEFALRLPSLVAMVATIACVWYGARFLVGRDTAKLAAVVLGSSPFVLALGKIALTDGVLLTFQTIAALALLRGVVRPSWKATVVLWLAVAGGLLVKGPPILILVGGMFLFLLVFHRRRRNLVHLHPWFGLPLALVPLAVWVFFAWQEDQRYVLFLGYWYILRRAGGSVFGQSGPPGAYFLVFFLGLVPWTAYVWPAMTEAWRGLRRRRLALVLLGSWLFGGWILWELLPSKLPTYTLGAYPALALLIARQVRRNEAGAMLWGRSLGLRIGSYGLVGISLGLAAGFLACAAWLGTVWCQWFAVLPATAIAATAVLAIRFQRRAKPRAAIATLFLGALAANLLAWGVLVPGTEARRSTTRQIARTIADQCRPDSTVVVAKPMSSPSLPFYVEQAALRFRDVLQPGDECRPRLNVDWSLLWKLRLKELVRQVKSQNPPPLTEDEDGRLRLQRVGELYRSGHPFVFVLDPEQFAALGDPPAGSRVTRIEAWQQYRIARTTYVLVMTPAALRQ
jgi:4-amino-4-deoxy-L-arabinose transferase-like glycosyltransferase